MDNKLCSCDLSPKTMAVQPAQPLNDMAVEIIQGLAESNRITDSIFDTLFGLKEGTNPKSQSEPCTLEEKLSYSQSLLRNLFDRLNQIRDRL